MDTIHIFLHDPACIDRSAYINNVFRQGTTLVPSIQSMSYFVEPINISDVRTSRFQPFPGVTLTTKSTLILDNKNFSSFLFDFKNSWVAEDRGDLFTLLDKLVFDYNTFMNSTEENPSTDLEKTLTTDPKYRLYKPASFSYSPGKNIATVYVDSETLSIYVPDYVIFNVLIPQGAEKVEYSFKVWVNNDSFYDRYPISNITAVVPPLPLIDIYERNITTSSDNIFKVSKITNDLNKSTLDPYIVRDDSSGYTVQNVKLFGPDKNYIIIPFNILYKGHIPGALEKRKAIREFIEASGIGSEAIWKKKIPELYIEAQFFLMPMWDNNLKLPDQVIYPSNILTTRLIKNVKAIMYDINESFVDVNNSVMSAPYDTLTLGVVANPENNDGRFSFLNEHPTYQNFASTEEGFQYMAEKTKQFALSLNNVLAIAAGKASETEAYPLERMDTRLFVTFTVEDVEYYVITRETYLNVMGEYGALT